MCDNLELEDAFIIDAKRQIESYEEILYRCKLSEKNYCVS